MDSDAGLTPYALRVKKNIEENQRVLQSLGLLNTSFDRRGDIKKTVRRSSAAVKSRASLQRKEELPASPTLPTRRTRRSSSLLQAQGYDDFDDVPIAADEENTPPHKKKKIAPEPVFGPIEGVAVGDWWASRLECSAAGVHRPTVAGIHGKLGEGCYSIALSGGYEDDVDYGEYFTYTGCGGRDLKGTKTNPKNLRTAPQTKDQVLEGPNAALALNVENHRAVRVIRGYKLPSPYAPEEGYRYDGLYSVERCWTATGVAGFKVYKFALKRLPDQDPPPWVNLTNAPAQNGHVQQNWDGLLEENGFEEHDESQSATSKVTGTSSTVLVQNNDKDEVTADENNSHITPRRRSLNKSHVSNEETAAQSQSTASQNSPKNNILENGTTNHIQGTPENDRNLRNSMINSVSTIKDPDVIEILDSHQSITENNTETLKQSHSTSKRKRRLSSANHCSEDLHPGETSKDCANNKSQDKNEDELKTLTIPEKAKSSCSEFDTQEVQPEQMSTDTLGVLSYKEDSPTRSNIVPINDKIELQCKEAPKGKKRLSSQKPDQERNKLKPESFGSPNNSAVESTKSPVTVRGKAQKSSSKQEISETLEGLKSSTDCLNICEKNPEREHPLKLTERKGSSSPVVRADGNKRKLETLDSLNLRENDLEDAGVKPTQKRQRKSSLIDCNPLSTVADEKESNSSKCTEDDKSSTMNAEPDTHRAVENPEVLSYNNHLPFTNVDDTATSPNNKCHAKLLSLGENDFNGETSSQTGNIKGKTPGKLQNSTEKKVRFSPEVVFNYLDGNRRTVKNIPISSLDSENKNSARKLEYSTNKFNSNVSIENFNSQEGDQMGLQGPLKNCDGDSKKQTSILRYFGPAKKTEAKQVTPRGILLRSNRRSIINSFLPVLESETLKKDLDPVSNNPSPKTKRKEPKSFVKKSALVKPFLAKINSHLPLDKTEMEVVISLERVDEIVEKQQRRSTESSPVKPCFVLLSKLDTSQVSANCLVREPFLGWDSGSDEDDFLGFDYDDEPLFHGFEDLLNSRKDLQLKISLIERISEE